MTSIAILEAVNTTAVQFHGQPIITAMVAGVAYVAMKPIVDNLGMSWTSQHRKLVNSGEKYGYAHMSIPSKGGIQEMLCLPLKKLNGWLFSINPEKVRADIRDKLIQYQEECFTVLHDYWNKGEAKKKTRQSTASQLTPLRQTAERLITTGMGKIYPDIWKLVHQRFDIEHIHQLQPDQIGEAVEFLNVLEGEFVGRETSVSTGSLDINFPSDWWLKNCHVVQNENAHAYELGVINMSLYAIQTKEVSVLGRILYELKGKGYNVDAAYIELQAMKHHLEKIYKSMRVTQEESTRAMRRGYHTQLN